jgi:IS5 family transposase
VPSRRADTAPSLLWIGLRGQIDQLHEKRGRMQQRTMAPAARGTRIASASSSTVIQVRFDQAQRFTLAWAEGARIDPIRATPLGRRVGPLHPAQDYGTPESP